MCPSVCKLEKLAFRAIVAQADSRLLRKRLSLQILLNHGDALLLYLCHQDIHQIALVRGKDTWRVDLAIQDDLNGNNTRHADELVH